MTSPPPLQGIRVLEFAGLAPGPYAGMILADYGASVLRIDRAVPNSLHTSQPPLPQPTNDHLARHKTSLCIDLKSPSGISLLKQLIPTTDILIDPFRPGVLEKLGLGPSILQKINPRLIYARMTGFRRDGKYKNMAGHDINYISVSGALSIFGRKGEKPHGPVNVVGDFGGGGSVLVTGVLLALLERGRNGKGQVVEANMVDGSAYLVSFPRFSRHTPMGDKPRGMNTLDGGCPWYDTYETKDGKYVAVGTMEPQFFAILIKGLGLQNMNIENTRQDRSTWPGLSDLFTKTFKTKTRDEWESIFDGTDACVTPVLEMDELESDERREGDQRPLVTLKETPSLAIKEGDAGRPVVMGQGKGVKGSGNVGVALRPGEGGEETLQQWMGWKRGRDYDVEDGALVAKISAKI